MRIIFASTSFILFLICSVNLQAAPAAPITVEFKQPDGTSISAIARGDEYASWMETLDGHTIIKESDTWYYAEKDSSGALVSTGRMVGSLSPDELKALPLHVRPEVDPASRERYQIRNIRRDDGSARTGSASQGDVLPTAISHTQYVVTILVNYQDKTLATSDATFQSLMYGASNSVRKYFLDSSYNGFTIAAATESQGTANDGIIRVTRPVAHPNQGRTTATSRTEASEIVNLANPFIDYASYDFNGDGFITADELSIVIILAGYENSYGGDGSLIPRVWGHKSSFTNRVLDGKTLSPYTMFGEIHGASNNPGGAHTSTIGIMAHELGHLMLGLPDLYDTDQSSAGIGDWGLMGGGSWNWTGGFSAGGSALSGDSPALLSAWSKVKTGLTVPQDIDTNTAPLTILQTATNEATKRIWIDKYKVNEYFLLENRQQTGFDARLPSAGLLIWHIDEAMSSNADESHKLVDLEEADGLAQLDSNTSDGDSGDPYRAGGVTTFNNNTNPNSRDYASVATGISVSSVSSSASSMTANIETLAGGVGDHVRYDENGYQAGFGLNTPSTTIWLGQQTLNTTTNTNLDGVDFYVIDSAGATVDVMYYSSIAGGIPSGLLYSQPGYAATPGWNRLLFDTPQSFPAGAERGIVVKSVNNVGTLTIPVDYYGTPSGRSYYDSNGVGTFASLGFDLNLVALLGGDSTPPAATVITPATTGPTNADSVSFNVTFSEDVVNFNNANDVIISHTGTASSGLNFAGSGSSYTVTVTGITGNGNFTLKVNTGSDVQDAAGTALVSSVTSAPVSIDNAAPTETEVTPSTTGPTNAGSVSFDITFSENVINFNDANDVSIGHDGTAHSGVSISGSGGSYTATVTGITGNGSLALKTNINSDVTDAAGNALVTTISSPDVIIDNANPSATSISSLSSSPTNADSVSFDVIFSEDVVNFNNANDIIVSHNGTASSGLIFVGSGSSYTVTVTGITGDGSFTLGANTGSDVEDAAGNALNSSVTSDVVSIDNTAPVVSIGAPSAASTQTGPVSYTITYEAADEITLSNGNVTLNRTDTADGVVNVTGTGTTTRTVTISGISGQGTLGISLDAGTASDTAGNSAGAKGPSATFSVIVSGDIFEDSFEAP